MVMYISLLQFTDQGIRNVKDTTKRAAAATPIFTQMHWQTRTARRAYSLRHDQPEREIIYGAYRYQ